uniref:PGG domain-containing protein n=1 Tax=Noccaea caerulescens TaxID=107243 RepID=A0A1J3HTR0_NOCCA
MALSSACSPNGSQPILSSDSERPRESDRQDTDTSNRWIGPIGLLMVLATIEAAVAFVIGFTCNKVYMSSAPDLGGITGFVKKTTFVVFVLCNSIPMLSSVAAVMCLMGAKLCGLNQLIPKALLFLEAMALVKFAYESMLVAFLVGVCLVVILLPWHPYFT